MRDCQDVARELHEFLDRELTDQEAHLIELHLERCPKCYQLERFETGVIKLVRRDCEEAAPEHLKARIRSMVHG